MGKNHIKDTNLKSEYPLRLKAFNTYMDSVKGSSENTTLSYSRDLMMFFRFLKIQRNLCDKNTHFEEINVSDIKDDFYKQVTLTEMYDFLVFSKKQLKNSSATISRKIASLRAFFSFLHRKLQVIDIDYSLDLDNPKIGKRKIKYMDLAEAQNLLDSVKSRNYTRDYCILTLFLNCGLRLAELCSIDISHIKNDTIRIIGKGDKERFVYLNESSLSAIEAYLPDRKAKLDSLSSPTEKEALFISERGNRIAKRTVQEIVEKQLRNAGISGQGLSTHKLRHTAATLLYKYGKVDILVLKEILGHENISTTQIYTHTDNDMIRNAVKVNPLNKL